MLFERENGSQKSFNELNEKELEILKGLYAEASGNYRYSEDHISCIGRMYDEYCTMNITEDCKHHVILWWLDNEWNAAYNFNEDKYMSGKEVDKAMGFFEE